MKKLIALHKDAVLEHTDVDYEELQKVTYIYQFDRVVQ
jgi:uncharacterized protein